MWCLRAVFIIGLCAVFLLGQWGCATQPPALPEELRAQLGTIGIVSAQYTPEPDFEGYGTGFSDHTSGAWEGLKSGATEGAKAGPGVGGSMVESLPADLPFMLLTVLVTTVVATVGAITGGLGGMTMGMINPQDSNPRDDQEVVKQALDTYLQKLGMQERIRKEVVAVARMNPSHQVRELDKEGPTEWGQLVSYHQLTEQGLDSIVEVSVLSLGLEGTSGFNPEFSIFMVVRADLRRVADDALLYRARFNYTSPSQPFDEWMATHALAFRMTLDKGYRSLAEQIVAKLL